MVIRKPLLQGRRQQQLLVGIAGKVILFTDGSTGLMLNPSYPKRLNNRFSRTRC